MPQRCSGNSQGLLLKKARVLIVDDNDDCRDTLALLLESVGYEMATAKNGRDAIQAARQFRPHIVLLDLAMPGMNGYEAAVSLRHEASLPDLYIAAVTGWLPDNGEAVVGARTGFDALFIKPVDFAALSSALDAAVARLAPSCAS